MALNNIKKIKEKLPRPKVSFGRVQQILFTLKEVLKISFSVKPKMMTAVLLINAFLGSSMVLAFYFEKIIIDRLIESIGTGNLQMSLYYVGTPLFFALLLNLLRNILQSYGDFFSRNLSRYFDIQTDVLLGSKISTLDIKTLENPEFRDKLNKIERESGRRAWQLMMPISEIPSYVFGLATAVGVIIAIHPLVSLVVLVLSVPRLLVNHKFIKLRYDLHSKLSEEHRIWSWIRSYLLQNRNFLELKLLDISSHLVEKLKTTANYAVDGLYNLGKKQINTRAWTYIPLSLFEFIVGVFLAYWVIIKKITVGTFQLYVRSLRSVGDNVNGLVTSLQSVYENYIYVSDLVWLLNLEPSIKNEKGKTRIADKISIKFNNVWFKYRKDTPFVLKDIDFKISPGEKIALVGENGAGKSTLIKLLARYYDPDKGDVEVAGKNLKEINLKDWREKLAVLFQQFETYPFSVKEAIGYGDVKNLNNLTGIKIVAEKVGINEYVESLPLKYDNPLAPEFARGVNPSVGQLQRIGIARMLFRKNASILILDEPTSNVDPEAEEKIFQELTRITKNKILIFVTQRFSTVRIADRIFVLHKGEIVEQGTHKELMNIGGKYARLYNLQAQAYLG